MNGVESEGSSSLTRAKIRVDRAMRVVRASALVSGISSRGGIASRLAMTFVRGFATSPQSWSASAPTPIVPPATGAGKAPFEVHDEFLRVFIGSDHHGMVFACFVTCV